MTELIITPAALETHMARAELGTERGLPRQQMRAFLNAAYEGLPDAPEQSRAVIQVPADTPA